MTTSGISVDMDTLAESYIKLVLSVGLHDPDYVDAYYGPPELRAQVEAEKLSLEAIKESAAVALNQARMLAAGAARRDGDAAPPVHHTAA